MELGGEGGCDILFPLMKKNENILENIFISLFKS